MDANKSRLIPALFKSRSALFLLVFASLGVIWLIYPHAANVTLHYTVNTGSNVSTATADGFNVFDVAGSTSNPVGVSTTVNALPSGSHALVWLGNLDNAPLGSACPAPGFTQAQFQAQVDALSTNSKVLGYYISDEPHPSVCPNAAADIKARADYIHAHTSQKTFIVVLDGSNMCGTTPGCEYAALAPSKTDVDLIGIDPYPCHYSGTIAVACDLTQITARVNSAEANGIPASAIVPTFQTFGQEGRSDGGTIYYRTPTSSELQQMLDTWRSLVPDPVMDYSYTFGIQCSATSCPAPQALANHPELQSIIQAHNASGSTTVLIGDLNNDRIVNITDLSMLLSKWGTADATADLNGDGIVNIIDLSMMLSHWGQT